MQNSSQLQCSHNNLVVHSLSDDEYHLLFKIAFCLPVQRQCEADRRVRFLAKERYATAQLDTERKEAVRERELKTKKAQIKKKKKHTHTHNMSDLCTVASTAAQLRPAFSNVCRQAPRALNTNDLARTFFFFFFLRFSYKIDFPYACCHNPFAAPSTNATIFQHREQHVSKSSMSKY
jgi:hypothetical protein